MRNLILVAVLLIPSFSFAGTDSKVVEHLENISLTISAGGSQGSGVVKTRVRGNESLNFVFTAAHVVDGLRHTKDVVQNGNRKTVIEFDDAKIIKTLVEDGRNVGKLEIFSQVIRFNKEEDLAVLRIRQRNFLKDGVQFYLDEKIPSIGTPLCHVGSLLGELGSNSYTTGVLSQQGRLVEGKVFDQTTVTAFPGCLTADTMVSMADGSYRKITDIKEGENVLCFGTESNSITRSVGNYSLRPVIRGTVTKNIQSGIKKILEIKTYNRTVKASGNHPFVKIESFKDLRGVNNNYMVWTNAENLKPGDIVATIKSHVEIKKSMEFNFGKHINKGSKNDFMKLLGFYTGDGYSRVRQAEGGEVVLYTFDEADDKDYSGIVKRLFDLDEHYGNSPSGKYLAFYNKDFAEKFKSWGVTGYAKTKRIPTWMFKIPFDLQRSYLEGLAKADGHDHRNSWQIELANKELIEDIYMMANHIGIRTSNISSRHKNSIIKGRNIESDTWTVELYLGEYTEGAELFGRTNMLSEDLRYERIAEINNLPEEMTYDLTVEKHHNFFANGCLVHNSSGGGVYLEDGRLIGQILRGAGEQFNLIAPVRRIVSWAKSAKMEWLVNDSIPVPNEEDLKKIPVEDTGVVFTESKYSGNSPKKLIYRKSSWLTSLLYLWR